MADGRSKNGGARRGAGRPPRNREDEIDAALREAVTPDALIIVWRTLVSRAQMGDSREIGLLFAYKYGRPPSMDENEIDARVEAELDGIIDKIKATLDGDSAAKVLAAIAGHSGA